MKVDMIYCVHILIFKKRVYKKKYVHFVDSKFHAHRAVLNDYDNKSTTHNQISTKEQRTQATGNNRSNKTNKNYTENQQSHPKKT